MRYGNEAPAGTAREYPNNKSRCVQRAAWVLSTLLICGHGPVQSQPGRPAVQSVMDSLSDEQHWQRLASPDARRALARVTKSSDNAGRPFAIVDKAHARIHLFDAKGKPRGSSPALLGQQAGDHSTPGVGSRPIPEIKNFERTTPAGRFSSEPGINASGERVVWFDYNEALAIHRARPGKTFEKRLGLLARNEPNSSKDSLGCIIVPPAFYDAHVAPLLGLSRSVVYVLPETRALDAAFADPQPLARAALPTS